METAVQNRFWILIIFMLITSMAMAQNTPALERLITLECNDEPIERVLKLISKEAKVTFSYTSADLDVNKSVTATFKAKTVREVLEQIFKGTVSFKAKGKYIILAKVQPVPQKTSAIQTKPPFFINGYVKHAATGDKLKGVSIYDTHSLTAAVTDEFGYFSLMLKDPQPETQLAVSRKNFTDTLIRVMEDTYLFLTIPISPEVNPEVPATIQYDTITKVYRDTVFIPQPQSTEITRPDSVQQNINVVLPADQKDTLVYKYAQASVLPFIGTNGALSNKTINNYSFNLIGGTSAGTRHLEIGGVFNINRMDVSYVQLGGIFNFNGGRMYGMQLAGAFNVNRRGIKGFQAAGVANVNTARSEGAQFAGAVNVQHGPFRGAQIAGIANVSIRKMKGIQVAPLVNYARNLRGMQIGFINVADTLRGVPIGFISYVKRGYHKLEFSADEIFYTNIAFRTGTQKFYNIFTFGIKPESDPNDEDRSTEWTFGYGFGMAPEIFSWLNLNIDLTANQLSKGEFTKAINLLNKAYLGLEIQPFDRIGIAFGVTLNGHLTKNSYDGYYDIFTDYRPRIIKEHDYNNNTHLVMWWGYKAAIRFF